MKKILEKYGMLRCIGAGLGVLSLVLFVVSAFVEGATPDTILKLVGMVLFLVGGMILSISSEEHRLLKSLLVFIVAGIIFTWLFPYGFFQGSDFYEYSFKRVGLVDISYAFYHSIYFVMDKIIFLLALGGFYGVMSKTSGYQVLVTKIANKLKGYVMPVAVGISIILFALTSLFTQTYVVLIFVPFFVSILLKMNLDKFTAFAVTFGSVLVGVLGCTYGTDTLIIFNNYISQDLTTGLNLRLIVAAITLVFYNFFLVMRIRKIQKTTKKTTKNSTIEDDPFKVETTKEKANIIPVAIILGLIAIITILGYVDWNANFGIEAFDKFHTWLTGLEVGQDFTIISYILGTEAKAFGAFPFVFTIAIVLLLGSALIAYLYKMKSNEFVENFYTGLKMLYKPILFLIGAYVVFGISYISPVAPTVANWLANLVEGFNPFITSAIAFVTSVFQIDFGYISYTIGGLITSTYAANIELAHTIFLTIYGLVQVVLPTSALLVLSLSMMKVDYKDWIKYIWMFVVGMLVVLLILFTVVTYI